MKKRKKSLVGWISNGWDIWKGKDLEGEGIKHPLILPKNPKYKNPNIDYFVKVRITIEEV